MPMPRLPDIPLSSDAERLLERLRPRIRSHLDDVEKVAVSVLLWGPGLNDNSALGTLRRELRTKLRQQGHAAAYSEELCDPQSPYSIRLQQLAQAQEFDLIVSLPCTPGSIAEVHDFASDRRISAKILLFLNRAFLEGYSAQSLEAISTLVSCRIEYYLDESDFQTIEDVAMREVQRIREMRYILDGRF
jgi:hypothetical protein